LAQKNAALILANRKLKQEINRRQQAEDAFSRSHALRGNACLDAPRRTHMQKQIFFEDSFFFAGRGASMQAFPRRAWEREKFNSFISQFVVLLCKGTRDMSTTN